jgi:hypothetical protein
MKRGRHGTIGRRLRRESLLVEGGVWRHRHSHDGLCLWSDRSLDMHSVHQDVESDVGCTKRKFRD